MEPAVVVLAPIGVQALQALTGQGVAGVERRELELATDHVVDGREYSGMGIDPVEDFALVGQVREAAGALFLVDLGSGVYAFLLAEFLEAGAQALEPFGVDDIVEDYKALFIEIVSFLIAQLVLVCAELGEGLGDIHLTSCSYVVLGLGGFCSAHPRAIQTT